MSFADRCQSSLGASLCLLAALAAAPQVSQAVPSYARQTGMACAACHTTYPELTAFGRDFKLNGYTMTNIKQIEAERSGTEAGVKINQIPPISAMLTASFTQVAKTQPGTQNGDVSFPQEFSVFFAGEVTPHIGSFVQVTYAQDSASFDIDNTDFRYADHMTLGGADTIYGVTVNNSPTVEDPWNSTPTWGFPFIGSPVAPTPAASPLITQLGQDVAGIGGYTLWNNHLYADISLYRSAHHGPDILPNTASSNTIKGLAPYWRLAWQQSIGSDNLEIGTFGMQTNLYPNGVSGLTDKYTDMALDAQYEHTMGTNMLTLRGNYIHEKQDLNRSFFDTASANPSNTLNALNLNGSYHLGTTASVSLGYFSTTGSTDTGLYAPNPVDGSLTGSPDSRGYIAQVTYLPWQNTQFALQYTGYTRFNGGNSNYDGSGRSASDNNALFLHAWLVF
jgi:hypothetical protein